MKTYEVVLRTGGDNGTESWPVEADSFEEVASALPGAPDWMIFYKAPSTPDDQKIEVCRVPLHALLVVQLEDDGSADEDPVSA